MLGLPIGQNGDARDVDLSSRGDSCDTKNANAQKRAEVLLKCALTLDLLLGHPAVDKPNDKEWNNDVAEILLTGKAPFSSYLPVVRPSGDRSSYSSPTCLNFLPMPPC